MRFNLVGRTVKVKMIECGTCGRVHREGVPCPNCGDSGNPKDEPNALQRFVRSMRERGTRKIEKVVDWSADLQVCQSCGIQFSRSLNRCPSCGEDVPTTEERFVRSLR